MPVSEDITIRNIAGLRFVSCWWIRRASSGAWVTIICISIKTVKLERYSTSHTRSYGQNLPLRPVSTIPGSQSPLTTMNRSWHPRSLTLRFHGCAVVRRRNTIVTPSAVKRLARYEHRNRDLSCRTSGKSLKPSKPIYLKSLDKLLDTRRHLQTCGQIPRGCSAATSTIEIVSFRYATVSLTDGWAEGPVKWKRW